MSQYAKEIKHILAALNQQGDEQDTPLPEEEELDTIHVYPVEGGGILFTRTPLEPDESAPSIIDSQDDQTTGTPPAKPLPLFVLFLLLLCVFVLGDLADTQLIALMTPTATIAITPEVRSITLQSTATLGKLLAPLTLTESQTVPTTGHGHQDARHAKVTTSMTAALHGQLLPGQELHTMPCTPATTANHAPGEEATSVTVSVSETCTAVVYDMQQLNTRATQLLATQVTQRFGTGYLLNGDVQVSVSKATAAPSTAGVILAFTCQGTYAYTLNGQAQQRIKTLVAGKPRLTALRLLSQQRGIQAASINGIADNQPLPDDQTHIHLLIVLMPL